MKCLPKVLISCMLIIGLVGSSNRVLAQTVNYVTKFSSSPPSVINSQIFDNGTYVGIGTASPLTKLDITGSGSAPASPPLGFMVRINNTFNGGYAGGGLYSSVADVDHYAGYFMGGRNYFSGNVGIGTTNPLEKFVVNGRVAIGTVTSSPYANLTVDGVNGSQAIIGKQTNGTAILVDGGTGYTSYKLYSLLDGVNSFGTLGIASGNGIYADFATAKDIVLRADTEDLILSAASSIRFGTNPPGTMSEKMTILNNGNVLIGKTNQANSNYKLDVEGFVRCNELKVNTTGADFVFEKNYKLLLLSDVEEHIKQNKHLPGIPSAKEMQENGISVGEMQTKLLQKIEELTLYMIDLKKENITLQKEIDKLMNTMTAHGNDE